MNLGLAGRTAVVTGSSRGIGAATATLLEAEGARVIGVSRSGAGIDVTDPRAPQLISDLAGGTVDILVNNAGTSFMRPIEELTDEDWQAQWDLHVMAPMRLMRHFAPQMAGRAWGRIVNVSSSSGKRPSGSNAAYSVTKAALLSLSRAFADQYAAQGVLVNAVAPGPVETDLWMEPGGLADQAAKASRRDREEVLAQAREKIPLGRYAGPGEIAAVIAFLCSERASTVAGAAWSADGGTVPVII